MSYPRAFLFASFATALAGLALATSPARAGTLELIDPIPVVGGARVLLPGPRRLGFAGSAADPSTIGNFRGLVALAYLKGKIKDTSGRRAVMSNDIRLFQGDYVAADGVQRSGTFAFV